MLILDFTNQNKASNAKKGYFKQWNKLVGGRGEYNSDLDDTDYYHSETPLIDATSTKGNKSLASYFNSLKKLNQKTKWLFGNENKVVDISPMRLEFELDDYSEVSYLNHFVDNIFSLGNGVNYFNLDLEFYEDNDDKMQASVKKKLTQKGYKATILGGSGMDLISIDGDVASDFILNSKSCIVANTNGGKDRIEAGGDFKFGFQINSGTGSDQVNLEEANSSFVNAGKGNDTVVMGRDRPWELRELKVTMTVKDIVIGGSGRDQYVFNQGQNATAYNLNGGKDFCVLKDFQPVDGIIFYGSDELRIDSRNGKVKLAATGAYKAQSIGYTARLYADNDLIAYISGAEPSLSDISQIAFVSTDS